MSLQDGTTIFKLSRPLKYKQGGDKETTTLELHEPGMAHAKYYPRLKQMITKAQVEAIKARKELAGIVEEEREDTAGKEVPSFIDQKEDTEKELQDQSALIEFMINTSTQVDAVQFLKTFENMVLMPLVGQARPICRVSDSVIMTDPLWVKLHPDDAFNMAVRWCAFFAMPSKEGEKTSSEPQQDSQQELTVA